HPTIAKLPIGALDYRDLKAQNNVFSDLAGCTFNGYRALTFTGDGEPEQLRGVLVTYNLFPLLGAKPLIGRTFLPRDEVPGNDRVAMLSEEIWRRRFSGDTGILGRSIDLDGQSLTVIGVLSSKSEFPIGMDAWLPISQLTEDERTTRVLHALVAVGRLKPGVSIQQAQTEISGIGRRLAETYPATNTGIGLVASPFADQFVGSVRLALLMLLGAVALVLLIACANVANLLLASGSSRMKEIAIRSALGASRRRLVTQLLTETALLSVAGAAGGVALAYWSLPVLKSSLLSSIARDVPRIQDASINLPVLAFAAGTALVTGILFGALPAFQISGTDLSEALKQEAAAAIGGSRASVRRAVVAAEVALAVVVLVGAGLLVRSFKKVMQIDPGMRTDHVLTAHVLLPASKYAQYPQVFSFYEQALTKIRALPGVEGASTINNTPLTPSLGWTRFAIGGEPRPEPGKFPVTQSRAVTPDYFGNMGIALRTGRAFNEADIHDFTTPPLIINETMARRFFNGRDPVGRQILLGVMTPEPTASTICGVVADAHDVGVDVPTEAEIYFPAFGASEILLVRTSVDPLSVANAVRGAILRVDKDQPIDRVQTLDSILADSLARRRFSAVMLGIFSMLALLLASVGLYGVVSYSVTQRTREIGLRVALGASRAKLVRMLVGQGMTPVWFGLGAGVAGAFALTRLISTLLYGVSATDPVTFVSTIALLAGIGAIACYIPARRALSVDPVTALRHE
ncbi:MAG: ABC transporter permease, partial [Blastocatellia bacterium]